MKRRLETCLGWILLLFIGIFLPPRLTSAQDRNSTQSAASDDPQIRSEGDLPPPQVTSIAAVTAQIHVTQHCRRLLNLRKNVTRSVVADPKVVEVVQFRPNELVLIGLGQGSTTVSLWFEDESEPLVVYVETKGGLASPKASAQIQNLKAEESSATAISLGNSGQGSISDANGRISQVLELPAVPIGAPAMKTAPGTRTTAVAAPQSRYDGHALWPASDRSEPGRRIPVGPYGGRLARLARDW